MQRWKIFILVLLFGLAACGEAANPTPAPLPPTPLAVQPTPTTAVAGPASTLPPPPTVAPLPTSTAVILPTAADPDAILLSSLADFGTDRNPLTGEQVDPANLQRRPLAIKLSNSPPVYTRPQSGLNDADLIFEHTTEGAITRFTIITYGKTPPRVGPIRSARLIDVELPAMYDAALAYSGSSAGVGQRLVNADFRTRILFTNEPGYYRTGEDKPYEHTLYGNPAQFWQALEGKGLNTPPTFTTVNAFSSAPPPGGTPAAALQVDYQWTLVEWRYDPENGRYRRWADGAIHADGNTGEQVAVANVIVIAPNHVEDGSICEEIRDGRCVHLSVQIQLWGTGSAAVFRDGQRYDVTWQRLNRTDSLTFVDAAGAPFPLQIGSSWVQVVPNWLAAPLRVTE